MRAASPTTNGPRRQGLSVSVENVARIFGEKAHPRDHESKETIGNTSDSRHSDWRGVYPVELELVEIKVKYLKCLSVTRYHVGLFNITDLLRPAQVFAYPSSQDCVLGASGRSALPKSM